MSDNPVEQTAPIADASRNDTLDDAQTVSTSEQAEANATVDPADAARLLLSAISHMDDVVLEVRGDDWSAASPCDGWDAERVLRHVTANLQRTHDLLNAGGAYGNDTDPSRSALTTDEVDDTAKGEWQQASLRVTEALGETDLTASVEFMGRTVTIGEALALPTGDIAIHSWDIAVAAGADRELPADLLAALQQSMSAMPEERLRAEGMFGPEKKAPAGASETDRLMAFLGRDVPKD